MNVSIPCLCPPRGTGEARHPDGDTVTLKDPLPFAEAMTIRQSLRAVQKAAIERDGAITVPEYTSILSELYLQYGIASWTLVNDDDKPLPLTKANVTNHLLSDFEAASSVAEVADGLYTRKVILPLLAGASTLSETSPTPGRTSTSNGTPHPKRSKRSSISSSPTAGIAGTS